MAKSRKDSKVEATEGALNKIALAADSINELIIEAYGNESMREHLLAGAQALAQKIGIMADTVTPESSRHKSDISEWAEVGHSYNVGWVSGPS